MFYLGGKGERPWVIVTVIEVPDGAANAGTLAHFKTPREAYAYQFGLKTIDTRLVSSFALFEEGSLAEFEQAFPEQHVHIMEKMLPRTEEGMGDDFDLEQHVYVGGWELVEEDGNQFLKLVDGEEEE